jgi:hypothetical protein
MNARVVAAVGVVAVLAAGGVVYAVTADDENGRKAAIGDTTPGSVAYVAATGTDTGACSTASTACATVTYALTKVNAGATIKVSGTIHDHPVVSTQITISGAEAPAGSPAVIDGSNTPNTPVVTFHSSANAATLDHVRIEHGSSAQGGGIFNAASLTLNHVTVADNASSHSGGGIFTASGTLTINDSTLTGNSTRAFAGGGGAIYAAHSPVTITDSTISGNTAPSGDGGGIFVYDGDNPLTLLRSTVSGNKSFNYGGGIYGYNTKVISSTIAGNTAPFGGGIWAVGKVSVYTSTIVGNEGQGINAGNRGSFTVGSSIIAQNTVHGSTTPPLELLHG